MQVGAQLSFLNDLFEEGGCLFIIVRSADDLTDLGKVETLTGRFFEEKRSDLDVAEALRPHFEVLLDQADICIHVEPLDIVKCPG